uniref:Pre-mRNA-processing protein prp39, putative n=1 Tax=Arundo donax TaxID=35708 RepID=A0A0A9DVA1_ARUDO
MNKLSKQYLILSIFGLVTVALVHVHMKTLLASEVYLRGLYLLSERTICAITCGTST